MSLLNSGKKMWSKITGSRDIIDEIEDPCYSPAKPYMQLLKEYEQHGFLHLSRHLGHPATRVVVHPADRLIVSLLAPHLENGPWIAGGAALAWYNGDHVGRSDIDLFLRDEQQYQDLRMRIAALGASVVAESANAVTFTVNGEDGDRIYTLQLIRRRFFKTAQELLENFDISVCRVVTDGRAFLMGEGTVSDIKHKVLRMRLPLNQDAVKRTVKYWCYGYIPTEELFKELQTDEALKWQFAGQDGEYENAF